MDVRAATAALGGRVGHGEAVGGDQAQELGLGCAAATTNAAPLRFDRGPPYDACSAAGAAPAPAPATLSEPVPASAW